MMREPPTDYAPLVTDGIVTKLNDGDCSGFVKHLHGTAQIRFTRSAVAPEHHPQIQPGLKVLFVVNPSSSGERLHATRLWPASG